MKQRIIMRNGKFVPQIKENWLYGWSELSKGGINASLGIYEVFNTKEKAIEFLDEYLTQVDEDGSVVWEREVT